MTFGSGHYVVDFNISQPFPTSSLFRCRSGDQNKFPPIANWAKKNEFFTPFDQHEKEEEEEMSENKMRTHKNVPQIVQQ